MNDDSKPSINPYQVLDFWMKDGNLSTPYPKDLEGNRAISQVYFLNYFETSQRYFPFINNMFNNYNLFYISVKDLCIMLKEMVYFTSFKKPFGQAKKKKSINNKLIDIFKKRYGYLKKEEIMMLVDFVDKSEDKEIIYEMFGFRNLKSEKLSASEKKNQKKRIDSMINKDDILDSL